MTNELYCVHNQHTSTKMYIQINYSCHVCNNNRNILLTFNVSGSKVNPQPNKHYVHKKTWQIQNYDRFIDSYEPSPIDPFQINSLLDITIRVLHCDQTVVPPWTRWTGRLVTSCGELPSDVIFGLEPIAVWSQLQSTRGMTHRFINQEEKFSVENQRDGQRQHQGNEGRHTYDDVCIRACFRTTAAGVCKNNSVLKIVGEVNHWS